MSTTGDLMGYGGTDSRTALAQPARPGSSSRHRGLELLNYDVKANAAGTLPGRRVSFAMSCTGICVVGSATRRSSSAS
jgi:hypothetical protein